MAIAEMELKKTDADNTSTAGSKDTFESASKSPLPASSKDIVGATSTKIYGLYYSIKDFAFSMPDGWDDLNIGIFLECCRENIEEFRHRDTDETKVWHTVAKLGAEKSGSIKCFTVNSCIELAQCLKSYVLKNEKRIDNEAFKKLYNDIIDLLQYFPRPAENSNKNVRHRSRSKSTEKKNDVYSKTVSSVESVASNLSQEAKSNNSPVNSEDIESLIAAYCKQYKNMMFGPNKKPLTYIWSKVSQKVFEKTGLKVDVKKKLDTIKRNIAKEARKECDAEKREKKFLSLANDFVLFFDLMPPRTIKKRHFLRLDEPDTYDVHMPGGPFYLPSDSNESSEKQTWEMDRKGSKIDGVMEDSCGATGYGSDYTSEDNVHVQRSEPRVLKKRGRKKQNLPEVEILSDDSQIRDMNSNKPKDNNEEHFIQEDTEGNNFHSETWIDNHVDTDSCSQEPSVRLVEDEKADDSSLREAPTLKKNKAIERRATDLESDEDTGPPPLLQMASPRKPRKHKKSSGKQDENPNSFSFETKYSLRSGKETIQYFKPKPKRSTKNKTGPKQLRRILPQRSARSKTKSYNISEEDTSLPSPPSEFLRLHESSSIHRRDSPKRSSSPELRGFPVEASSLSPLSQSLSPMSKFKRAYNRSLELRENREPFELKEESKSKRRRYQRKYNKTLDTSSQKIKALNESQGIDDRTQYLEKVYGLRRKTASDTYSDNTFSDPESSGPLKNAIVMLTDITHLGSPKRKSNTTSTSSRLRSSQGGPSRYRKASALSSDVRGRLRGYNRKSDLEGVVAPNDVINVVHNPKEESQRHLASTEASIPCEASSSKSTQLTFPRQIRLPATLKASAQVKDSVAELENLDASTLSIIERYRSNISEPNPSNAMVQLVPSSQSHTVPMSPSICNAIQPISMGVVSKPPEWFGNFVSDYKKHEMWKMNQLLKMQQELVNMEHKKITVLEKILGNLKNPS